MTEFSEILKQLVDEKKIGTVTLAKMLKINREHAWFLLTGKRNPSPKMIQRIVEKLKLSPETSSLLNLAVIKDKGYKI